MRTYEERINEEWRFVNADITADYVSGVEIESGTEDR